MIRMWSVEPSRPWQGGFYFSIFSSFFLMSRTSSRIQSSKAAINTASI